MKDHDIDCVVLGYNEIPFERYERFVSSYGHGSEAYRDLRFSFVDIAEQKFDYPGLMNFALRAAKTQGGPITPSLEFKSGDIPNLAAVYLVNFLRRRGLRAEYVNLFQYEKDKLVEYLDRNPVCVAITTTFYVVNLPASEIVEFIRAHNDKTKIIVGGPLIANHARNFDSGGFEAAIKDIGADIYVLEAAGESTLSALVSCLAAEGDISSVPNLVYFKGDKLERTQIVPENNSLDDSIIDWMDFRNEELGYTLQTRTARSCAFNCSFCNYPARAGKLTLTSVDAVEREMSSIKELGGVKNVVFIDDTFNVPLPRFKDLCRMFIKSKLQFNWFSYFRCSNSDQEAFDLMAESGCKGVFLGIESGSPQILKNMNKAATIEKYAEGIKQLKKRNILTFGSFIVGFPGETGQTVSETVDFIRQSGMDYYRAQSWYCEPGTPVDRRREAYSIEGDGFVWSHATMDSSEAMDHIESLFLTVRESLWLPQWSFDFWIIPYLIGRGISLEQFREFMVLANRLLATGIASVPKRQKMLIERQVVEELINCANSWSILT